MLNECAKLKNIPRWRRSHFLHTTNADFLQWDQSSISPLHLEVGCGQGLHPIQWAQQHSGERLLALERTQDKFAKSMSRLQGHAPLKNLFLMRAEAQLWLPSHLKANHLESVFLLYPNPYPKETQGNKRWHRQPFMGFLLSCLKVGGTIKVASNLPWYLHEAQIYYQKFWQLDLCEHRKLELSEHFPGRTHFERKYLERGETCSQMVFKKSARTVVFDGN